MSGQWEVVGKNKKDKQTGKTKKMSKNEKKTFVDYAPKVEDLLPLAQVKTLYAALDTNKVKAKHVEKAVKTKENEAKKAQKKPKEKKEPPIKENKPPKTIEAAVALITTPDVENVLEVGQMRFSEAPLIWLKGLASWLNTKLPVDHTENIFTAKSWEYPLCLLSADTRAVLKKAIRDVPNPTVQMFYDYCLTSMANDMTKGCPVTGYKMLVQLVASQVPSVAVTNLAKSVSLRHSYQNRPAIGCSVMWALGLGGFKDVSVGLSVWQEVMYPVYELRNYTHFVCDYLKHLLARHSTSKAVTAQQYLAIVDTVFSGHHAPNADLKAHLRTLQGIVRNVEPDNRLHSLFEPLLLRLGPNNSPALNDQLLWLLTECLVSDSQTCKLWRQLYTHHLPESAVLLRHLNSERSTVSDKLSSNILKETLRTFKVTNDDMLRHKLKTEGLQECVRLCEALIGKKVQSRSFSWKTFSFMLVLVVAGIMAYDFNTHGTLRASRTGMILKNIGALEYSEQAFIRLQEASKQVRKWIEQNIPLYTTQIRGVLGPYFAVIQDIVTTLVLQVYAGTKLILQYCEEKKPLVEEWVNTYTPGLVETLSLWGNQVWQFGLEVCSLVLKYLSSTLDWLQDNVFVGKLSPENLQRVTLEAINTTQTLAAQTFSWLNSKVVTASSKFT